MTSIVCPLSTAVTKYGDAVALIENDRRISYRELAALVSQLTEHLLESGVKPGDRVAIIEKNRLEYVVGLFALFRLGAIACLFNHHLGRHALKDLVQRVGCTSQLTFSGSDVPQDQTECLSINIPLPGNLPPVVEEGTVRIDVDRPATIMTTSGSTGSPKIVVHTYGNHWHSATGSNLNIPVNPGDRWLVSLSLFHVGGLAILLRCLLGGGTAVMGQPSNNLLADIKKHRITHISVVATQLRRLLADPAKASDAQVTKQLKAVLLGGGSIDDKLAKAARQAGLPLYTSYGLTEMASQVCTSSPGHPGIIIPLEGSKVCISDSSEILVKGKTLFRGYVEGDDVRLPVDDDGWFHTGDLGKFDEQGGLTITGRIDNMFVSGGENIHPEEIEKYLIRQDEVTDAVVVPVSDAEFDYRPAAFVLFTSSETTPSEAELKAWLVDQGLPGLKIPVAFFPWPKDNTGSEMKPNRSCFKKEAQRLFANN